MRLILETWRYNTFRFLQNIHIRHPTACLWGQDMVCLLWYELLSWCRHQMETFSALLAICAGNSPVPGEFPTQRPVTRSSDVFFDLRLNKLLIKQSWGWWCEMPSCPLWCHCHVIYVLPQLLWCCMEYPCDGLVQDCSNSGELAMVLLHSCTKPSILYWTEL